MAVDIRHDPDLMGAKLKSRVSKVCSSLNDLRFVPVRCDQKRRQSGESQSDLRKWFKYLLTTCAICPDRVYSVL